MNIKGADTKGASHLRRPWWLSNRLYGTRTDALATLATGTHPLVAGSPPSVLGFDNPVLLPLSEFTRLAEIGIGVVKAIWDGIWGKDDPLLDGDDFLMIRREG